MYFVFVNTYIFTRFIYVQVVLAIDFANFQDRLTSSVTGTTVIVTS